MGGSSKSSSDSTTQSTSEDNRVAGDNGAIVLGKDAVFSSQNYFSDNVKDAFSQLVQLVEKAGEVVVKTSDQAQQNALNSVNAVTTAIQNDKQGTSTTESTIVKYIPLIIGAVVLIFVVTLIFRKKG